MGVAVAVYLCFDPSPGNFRMLQVHAKKEEKKERNEKYSQTS